jgi:solute:Na+ symporter, SSS family
MASFHFLDYCIVAAYLVLVTALGKVAVKGARTQEGFFLAGRKLGKVYQFFLNFGHSTDATGAVSTASIVYQQGVSGVWVGFQMIFLNPYYWFMYSWFRRVRLTTMADLFEDRLGSRGLAWFYSGFQIVMAVAVTMAFCNLVSYKISAALVTKAEAHWTTAERQSVDDYRELTRLEAAAQPPAIDAASRTQLAMLQERHARGELRNYVTALEPWSFYFVYTLVIGAYIVMGGMAANALAEAVQGGLVIVFSAILIPAGLAAIGGWQQLGEAVPAGMFHLFGTVGSSEFTGWTIAAVFFATMLTAHAGPGNMGIAGSARNEFAARFGAVAGTFGKRLMTILWAFCGLIAIALFSGANRLADADLVWGTMSRHLLGPGMLGLMAAGVLAANMSTVASHAMAASGLFARNIYRGFRPDASDADTVRVARWTLVVVLALAGIVSAQLSDVYTVLQFAMTMNVPFGASILLMFVWRRVTAAAVWIGVLGSAFANILFPLAAQSIPALATNHALVARSADAQGRPAPVYFERVVRLRVDDPASPLEGAGRLHTELIVLRAAGVDVVNLSPGGRLAGRFLIDGLLPLVLVLGASLLTRAPARERVEQFFGKMKTPVGATPEEDAAAMEETRRQPRRFDGLKLWPGSAWEWTRWNAVDSIGFAIACGVTVAILALFWGLLRWAEA